MALVSMIMSPAEQREALYEIMDKRERGPYWLAEEIGVSTVQLRRWLQQDDPETNRQRFEWHNTHEAVMLFLATYTAP